MAENILKALEKDASAESVKREKENLVELLIEAGERYYGKVLLSTLSSDGRDVGGTTFSLENNYISSKCTEFDKYTQKGQTVTKRIGYKEFVRGLNVEDMKTVLKKLRR